jgi:hypothetical protein
MRSFDKSTCLNQLDVRMLLVAYWRLFFAWMKTDSVV